MTSRRRRSWWPSYRLGPQSISFVNTPASAAAGDSHAPVATAIPSGLPVSLSVYASSTGCSLATWTVTFDSAGICVINADQPGDADYLPATWVQRSTLVTGGAHRFTGFSAPVDNGGASNLVKASQTAPLRWRLTTSEGVPVTNLSASDVSVRVSELSCSTGTSVDAVEEYSTGSSGLQNLGDGYYQWNWKTPRTYAESCKTMTLSLVSRSSRSRSERHAGPDLARVAPRDRWRSQYLPGVFSEHAAKDRRDHEQRSPLLEGLGNQSDREVFRGEDCPIVGFIVSRCSLTCGELTAEREFGAAATVDRSCRSPTDQSRWCSRAACTAALRLVTASFR